MAAPSEGSPPGSDDDRASAAFGQLHEKVIASVERLLFSKVLQFTHGNQGKACDLLGLNRSTLRHRLRTLGLAVDKMPVEAPRKEPP